jgi:hypothetical protein
LRLDHTNVQIQEAVKTHGDFPKAA